jgi:hypothetical protein
MGQSKHSKILNEEEEKAQHIIPKIIHFIWAGGDKTMPEKNIQTVLAWKEKNPSFNVWLWVDKRSVSSEEVWKKSLEDYQGMISNNIRIKDVENVEDDEMILTDEFSRYEIDRLRPNYGASSDLLRYEILFQYGGAYFDSDVTPGLVSLEESGLFGKDYDRHYLSVDNNSQNTGEIGNDALICTTANPLMLKIKRQAINHYTLQAQQLPKDCKDERVHLVTFNAPHMMAYFYEDPHYIEDVTSRRSGPFCVRLVVEDEENKIHNGKTYISEIGRMQNITKPLPANSRSWIGMDLTINLEDDKCLERIKMTINFEFNKFKILRLDDHINNLMEANKCNENQAFNVIFQIIDRLDMKAIIAVQLTFQHDTSIRFCQNNKLMGKTFLLPGNYYCEKRSNRADYYKQSISSVLSMDKLNFLYKELQKGMISTREMIENASQLLLAISKLQDYIIAYSNQKLTEIQKSKKNINKFCHYIQFVIGKMEQLKKVFLEIDSYMSERERSEEKKYEEGDLRQAINTVFQKIEMFDQLKENVRSIPTKCCAFFSRKLDEKTPLLRDQNVSQGYVEAKDEAGCCQKYFGRKSS